MSTDKPQPYKKDNPPTVALTASAAKFWAKVEKPSDPNGCWNWTSTLSDDGAASWLFSYERVPYRIPAYRAVLVLVGSLVEPGDVVFRKCRNKLCVNPEHIGIGDHEDNVAARHEAGRSARGIKNGRAKLTEEQVGKIKLLLRRGEHTNMQIAKKFGVDKRAVWGIAAGRVWKHVPEAAE